MEISYGAQVIDKKGDILGVVNHIVLDSWTGEMRKFVIRGDDSDLFVSPADIQQASQGYVKLNVSSDELSTG
jgi:sporulation protein YlmC with PRC-barrel domain